MKKRIASAVVQLGVLVDFHSETKFCLWCWGTKSLRVLFSYMQHRHLSSELRYNAHV